VVVITEMEDADPVLVDLVREADDAEGAVRSALLVGARAVRAAGVNVDTEVIDRRFASMAEQMERQVDQAVGGISKAIGEAVAEDGGAIPLVFDKHRADLEALLGSTFDPESKSSVISLIEGMLAEAQRSQVDAVARMVTVDGDDSPLAKLRTAMARDVKESLKDQMEGVHAELKAVSENMAVNAAVAPVIAITTAKGFTFEDVLHARVEALALGHGDLAEQTGTAPGVAGTKKGDEVVTLDVEDTRGSEVRFVLEAKSTKLSLRKAYEELDAAIENRDAAVGVIVFSSMAQAPTTVPFHYSGNRAIVVLDEDGVDDGALRLAYMWARWMARRELSDAEVDAIDLDRISTLIGQARTALGRVKTIRSCHSKIVNAAGHAGDELSHLNDDVQSTLSELASALETC
jgi:hypothetical protein